MVKLGRLLRYTQPYAWGFLGLSVAAVLMSLASVLQPWPLKLIVDNVIGEAPLPVAIQFLFDSDPAGAWRWTLLAIAVVSGVFLFAVTSFLDALSNWAWTVLGRRMAYDLAQDLLAKLQQRSLAYHSRVPVGEKMARVCADSWSVHTFVNALVFEPAHALVTITLMLFVMLQVNAVLTAVAFAAAPVIVISSLFAGRRMRAVAERQRDLEGRMRAYVHQVLLGMPIVQAFTREQQEEQRFRTLASDSVRAEQRSTIVAGANSLASGLGMTLGNAAVLLLGAHQVLADQLTIGELLVFVAYLGSLQQPLRHLAAMYPAVQTLGPSIDRVDDVLQTEPEVAERPGAKSLPKVRGEVHFEAVSFAYHPDWPILRGVSLKAEPGQTIALVGPTGAGKSTLVSLIPRFLDPTAGRVLIDQHDVCYVKLASLRSQVAIVLQEPFLLPLTIAENVAFGRPGASREQVEAAARAANAHGFISGLPQGYDTPIGEGGATLSGGERQRISIARALLKDAPILILDEPTSALDAETEALIMDALRKLMRDRTTFIAAHRLATIRQANLIVVLKDGVIAESGTHGELIRSCGLYADYARGSPAGPPEFVAS